MVIGAGASSAHARSRRSADRGCTVAASFLTRCSSACTTMRDSASIRGCAAAPPETASRSRNNDCAIPDHCGSPEPAASARSAAAESAATTAADSFSERNRGINAIVSASSRRDNSASGLSARLAIARVSSFTSSSAPESRRDGSIRSRDGSVRRM